jgi:hypothetical protein
MRTIALYLLPLVCLAAGPADIEALIGQARSAPPEFAADALIRLAGVSQLTKARRVTMLEEAFRDAASAQQPYKRRFAALQNGGPSRFYNQVYNQDLDGLSLRLRAVDAMLPLDARKARELFEQIAPPDLPRLTCNDFLVYDVSRLYDVLARVVAQGFNDAEIARREPQRLVSRYAVVTSPAQVAPVAGLLLSAGLNDRDFRTMATTFAAALREISGDDRSYTLWAEAGPRIQALAKECENRGMAPAVVIEAYRAYLVDHLSGARCADSGQSTTGQSFGMITGRPVATPGETALTFFNQELAGATIQPIEGQEAAAAKREGAVPAWRLCEDAGCKDIVGRYRALVMTPAGIPYTAVQKTEMEWKNRLDDLISAMASWKEGDGPAAAEGFREKAELYGDLFGVVSDNDGRQRVARANLAFLAQSRFRAENPLEWFLPVSVLIGRARLDPLALSWLGEEIERNHDPLIGLYADLEKIAPRAPESILSLM